ncbi:hypothetical protein F4776DRAFT_672044 [Hypoxylon sp. NC0597]|nr:hypothetical protein F4776DRAFT_672044 [Hypoxylon sp. NC0597]
MASFRVRALRATFQTMDGEKVGVLAKPFVDSGLIEWEGGKVKIIYPFHHVDFFNRLWVGVTPVFATSTFEWDSVGWWQVFSFLVDLGPLYALWILEPYRVGSTWAPAYLYVPLFSLTAQIYGIGLVALLYYFLYITFGPTASDLGRACSRNLTVWHRSQIHLLLIVLLLHTAMLLLLVLGQISSGVCPVYILVSSPYSLSTMFIPEVGPQSEFLRHMRKALQADELAAFINTFLWLTYSYFDLYSAGLMGNEWLFKATSLPIITLLCGLGTAFIVGWYMGEIALVSPTEP